MKDQSEEKERKRDSWDPRFIPPLLLAWSSLSKKASHSSLWSLSASKGHRRTRPNSSTSLLQNTKQTSSCPAGPSSPALLSWMGLLNGFKQRLHSCSQLFYTIRPIQHWEFADYISNIVDNYFSASVPAGRIYSQYTACSITLIHSFSSTFFLPLPFSLSFPASWELYLYEI